jgi:hypothetical protein
MMTRGNYVLLIKIKRYVRENLGSPFIGAFVLLLILAAAFLYSGSSFLANEIAVYAYYVLIVGVFLQLACFLKDRKKVIDSEVFDESS